MQLWQHNALRSIHMRLLHFEETKSFIHVTSAKCIICLRDYRLMISDVTPSIYQSWATSKVEKTATKTLLRNCKLGARKLRFGS